MPFSCCFSQCKAKNGEPLWKTTYWLSNIGRGSVEIKGAILLEDELIKSSCSLQ
jgi:hypothetical protein